MLRWLFGGRKAAPPPIPSSMEVTAHLLNDDGSVEVVGESHYQPALRAAVAACGTLAGEIPTTRAILMREPDNPHDPHAVAIYLEGHEKIGYLSRADARAYGPVLRTLAGRGVLGACGARIYGGEPGRPSFGVWLDLAPPDRALED